MTCRDAAELVDSDVERRAAFFSRPELDGGIDDEPCDVALFALPLVAGSSIAAGWVTARPESDAATVEAILDEELGRMTREPVTDDELARAHALVESAEYGALSRMDEVADRLSMYATYFDRPELINEQLGRYLAVDAEAIRSACAQTFGSDARAVLTYIPRPAAEAAA